MQYIYIIFHWNFLQVNSYNSLCYIYHVSLLHTYFIPSSLSLLILYPILPFFASLFPLGTTSVVFFFLFVYLWVCFCLATYSCLDFPGGSSGKESTCQWRRWRSGFSPWVGKILWRRKWQPTPLFLPGEAHGQRSLVGYSPMGSQRVSHNWTHTHKVLYF